MVKPVSKGQPGGPVCQGVAVRLHGIIQSGPHAISGFAVPTVLSGPWCQPRRLPQPAFLHMGATGIPA